ncbi:ABC transporter permease [Tahibacter amnicola]|uniref:ABC transporter permease n=1 Tax=Tahibacter amnicola TaxID=2976241 RepID=A0ABY6BDB8_9GAMM|nr:ABC transporter permease [Tahibacter amnicola]UXI67576.1 ABC transporter permease [Tahibacter amnicola]
MFAYYLQLGLRSLKRNPILTLLMVFGIALGIGTSMTSLTVFYLMGSDPIPWKSDKLFIAQVDSWDPLQAFDEPNLPPDQMTYRDASTLVEDGKADRQTAMYKIAWPVQPENPEIKPFMGLGRATYGDFFPMFDTPFLYGNGWDRGGDKEHARVVVLSRETNEKLFGGQNSVGKRVKLNDVEFTVAGVLDTWEPRVKYYDLTNGTLNDSEDFYVPFTTSIELKTNSAGNNNCWNNNTAEGWEGYLQSECIWIQYWVELSSASRVAEYRSYLDNYVNEQKKLGRFPRPLNNRLHNVTEWMEVQKVVPQDVRIQVGLSFAFLAVCLVNTIGLLLAKFLRKSGEIGLRRALGAKKSQLFTQYIVESGVIGVSGGLLGLLLTFLGLTAVRALNEGFEQVARLDWVMVITTILLSVAAAIVAGLYPTWRACQIAPAAQLKTQ